MYVHTCSGVTVRVVFFTGMMVKQKCQEDIIFEAVTEGGRSSWRPGGRCLLLFFTSWMPGQLAAPS